MAEVGRGSPRGGAVGARSAAERAPGPSLVV